MGIRLPHNLHKFTSTVLQKNPCNPYFRELWTPIADTYKKTPCDIYNHDIPDLNRTGCPCSNHLPVISRRLDKTKESQMGEEEPKLVARIARIALGIPRTHARTSKSNQIQPKSNQIESKSSQIESRSNQIESKSNQNR